MIRHKATDTAQRVGSVFFNPGGPGGAGTQELPPMYESFPPQVRARFDIVSFDPRGIGASTGLHCFPNAEAEAEFLAQAPAAYPVGAEEEAIAGKVYARFDAVCARRAGSLLSHMSTANVARDMDLMRQAVGEHPCGRWESRTAPSSGRRTPTCSRAR
jgi:pimeloyl-ACP methyl ester carboxylesterase